MLKIFHISPQIIYNLESEVRIKDKKKTKRYMAETYRQIKVTLTICLFTPLS